MTRKHSRNHKYVVPLVALCSVVMGGVLGIYQYREAASVVFLTGLILSLLLALRLRRGSK